MSKRKVQKIALYILLSLPLAGAVVADLMPISARSQQFLMMIVLIWAQVFFVFEMFQTGR